MNLNEALDKSCISGDLNLVKSCLNNKGLIKVIADIHFDNDIAIKYACYYGHLEIVKYLLTSPDLKEHANIHNDGDNYSFKHYYNGKRVVGSSKKINAFAHACTQGHLDIVQYLLNSPELEKPAVFNLDEAGLSLLNNIAFRGEIKILDYLLNYYKDKNYPNFDTYTSNPIKKIKHSIMQNQWKHKKEAIFNEIFQQSSEDLKQWIQVQRERIKIQKHINTTRQPKKVLL